jgi:type II secretory pathway pseudopilin PulG
MSLRNLKNNKAFTIVEMIVAAFIFSMIMTVTVGATLSIVAANQQAEAVKSVISNFSFALESMVRNLRIGTSYMCGSQQNCNGGGDTITFTDYRNQASGYRLNGTALQVLSGTSWIDITSSDVKIDRLVFYVTGNGKFNDQPSVLIVIVGHVDFNGKTTTFRVETVATQRKIDSAETS